MKVVIDTKSGFCFGVVNAIKKAEDELASKGMLYCLGDIVHNNEEVQRLAGKGMKTISREEFFTMKNCRVLIRAHGEPPETYAYARENNIELIDATCPVVLSIQKKIKKSFEQQSEKNGQMVIYGKPGHAEVEGLNGQTGHRALVVQSTDDLEKIDFTRPISLYSQTTKPLEGFREIAEAIRSRAGENVPVEIRDTICRQVSNRAPHLSQFASSYDVVLFVAGKKSSNGAVLFDVCRKANPKSYAISNTSEINQDWFKGAETICICGATSTPQWLMEEVADFVSGL